MCYPCSQNSDSGNTMGMALCDTPWLQPCPAARHVTRLASWMVCVPCCLKTPRRVHARKRCARARAREREREKEKKREGARVYVVAVCILWAIV